MSAIDLLGDVSTRLMRLCRHRAFNLAQDIADLEQKQRRD